MMKKNYHNLDDDIIRIPTPGPGPTPGGGLVGNIKAPMPEPVSIVNLIIKVPTPGPGPTPGGRLIVGTELELRVLSGGSASATMNDNIKMPMPDPGAASSEPAANVASRVATHERCSYSRIPRLLLSRCWPSR